MQFPWLLLLLDSAGVIWSPNIIITHLSEVKINGGMALSSNAVDSKRLF